MSATRSPSTGASRSRPSPTREASASPPRSPGPLPVATSAPWSLTLRLWRPTPQTWWSCTWPRPGASLESPRTWARCHHTRLHVSDASLQRNADRVRLAHEAKYCGEARGVVLGPLHPSRHQGVGAPSRPLLEAHVPAGIDSRDDTAPVPRRPAGDRLAPRHPAPQRAPKRPCSRLREDPLDRPRTASSRPPVESGTGILARLTSATATSAGGIVVRYVDSIPQFVVGRRKRERDNQTWTLPKGTPIPGESLEETALREVCEETGLTVRILAPLDSIEYTFVQRRERIYKTVHYFMTVSYTHLTLP